MDVFSSSRWIWYGTDIIPDSYGEFYGHFSAVCRKGQHVLCRLSCDGDYTLFCNGRFVASNQYGDYEHYKIYDEIDLTPYLQTGENRSHTSDYTRGISKHR